MLHQTPMLMFINKLYYQTTQNPIYNAGRVQALIARARLMTIKNIYVFESVLFGR